MPPDSSTYTWLSESAARREAEVAAARLARLQAVTAALSGARAPAEVAEVALGAGSAALDGQAGAVLVPDAAGSGLVALRCMGLADGDALLLAGAAPQSPAEQVWRSGDPVFLEDRAGLVARFPGLAQVAGSLSCEAYAVLPLLVEGRALGVLGIGFAAPRPFPAEDRAFAAVLAGQCAQALDRARLFLSERVARAEAVAVRRRLSFLDELSTLLTDTFDEGEMLASLVRLAVPVLGDWAAVFVSGEGGVREPAAWAGAEPLGDRARALLLATEGHGPFAAALAGGPAAVIEAEPGEPGAPPLEVVVVGLAARGECYGSLAVAAAESGQRYGPTDLALISDVSRRTSLALEHARLYAAAKLAAQAREDFLHVASHELRGPLGTLRLAVQLLSRDLRGGDGSRAAERLRVMERQADRLVRLSDALLDVSRITAGRLVLVREEHDLAALAREAAARHAEQAAEARCDLMVEAPYPIPCACDQGRIEQVISNLLSNALKYGRGMPVKIGARREASWAVLEVIDRGIGIAPEDQARIFGRFERAVSPRNYGGLGLGLWIVRSLVEAHGGHIRVASAPGHGSTFTVELPLGAR
jgi:signal transduction histidine kinase